MLYVENEGLLMEKLTEFKDKVVTVRQTASDWRIADWAENLKIDVGSTIAFFEKLKRNGYEIVGFCYTVRDFIRDMERRMNCKLNCREVRYNKWNGAVIVNVDDMRLGVRSDLEKLSELGYQIECYLFGDCGVYFILYGRYVIPSKNEYFTTFFRAIITKDGGKYK